MEITASPVLPQLPPDEYRVIRDSIAEIGVQVPLLLTADHVLVDGHERWRAIQELEITKFPMRVVGCLSEAERVQLAIKLNLERRHLTVAQRRELAARLLREDACQTDRKVASAVGCDHKTVGKVRSDLTSTGEIPRTRGDGWEERQKVSADHLDRRGDPGCRPRGSGNPSQTRRGCPRWRYAAQSPEKA